MTLIHLGQRTSILAGMTFASLLLYSTSVRASRPQNCAIPSDDRTICGASETVKRVCVTTDSITTLCNNSKLLAKEGQQNGESLGDPPKGDPANREQVQNFVYTLKSCRKSNTTVVKCKLNILNKGVQRGLFIAITTNFIDVNGMYYKAFSREISGVGSGPVTLKTNTNYSASITFNNVLEGVTKAKVLNIQTNFGQVNFRDVTFSN